MSTTRVKQKTKLFHHSCKGCKKLAVTNEEKTIQLIQAEYLKSDLPWYLGFSGGKDSSALLKLLYQALSELELKDRTKRVTAIYCDTGVDIPIIATLVKNTLENISLEAEDDSIPLDFRIAVPKISDKYFVKVIGRGYPTPTNKFRWCTDKLRINPVKSILESSQNKNSLILLGVREGESLERDKIIHNHRIDANYLRQSGNSKVTIFAPILNYSVNEVWGVILADKMPYSIDGEKLSLLYKHSSGECPTIKDPKGSPCGKGRFGCWTCTVVRKDQAMQNLVEEGHYELTPLLKFRNWLMVIRDDMQYRYNVRRNGQPGKGPFTLAARELILNELLKAQSESGLKLIDDVELDYISFLWEQDRDFPNGI